MQELLGGEADALTRKCVQLALAGDTTALRMCMDRLVPVPRDRPISFPLPAPKNAEEVSRALGRVIEGVGNGAITPTEASSIAGLLEVHLKGIEAMELEQRVARLEVALRSKVLE